MDVLSSYYSWKYVRVQERWEMGIQTLTILKQVLEDVRPSRQESSMRTALLQSLAIDSSFHHILLSVSGIGHEILLKKSEMGQFGDRETLQHLVICGLSLLEIMLTDGSFRTENGMSSLENSLLTRKVGHKENGNQYLLLVIAKYVHYPFARKIPLLATRILTALCTISSAPPILGYLGDSALDIRQVLLELLASSPDLSIRIAILRLIGAAVDHQPGLAETLLTTPEEPSSSVTHRGKKSAVQVIMDMLSRRALYEHHPQLLAEALSLLHSLWSRAPNHTSILRSIRKEGLDDNKQGAKQDFWVTVTQCLDLDRAKTQERWADIFHKNLATHFEGKNDLSVPLTMTSPEQQKDIVRYCYNVLLHSIVLRILALECYYASDSLDDELKALLAKMRDSMQVRWFNEYTRFFFPSMKRRLEKKCQSIGLDPVVLTATTYAQKQDRSYGDLYIYDARLLKEKMSAHLHDKDIQEVLVLIAEANNQLSVADAQIVLLESWKTLLQVGVAKIPGKLIDASRGPEMGVKLIHGFQNKVDSRLRILEKLDANENTYLLEVVIGDLLDIGQHFTRVYLEPLLLGEQKVISYLVKIYCQLFRYEVSSLHRLQSTATKTKTTVNDSTASSNKASTTDQAKGSTGRVLDPTIEEMLRVKRSILTTILSVLLLFIHHQPEVFDRSIKEGKAEDVEMKAVWKVVFTEVLSLVPSIFQTCVELDASTFSVEDTRMLTSVSMALVTAILRNMKSAAGTEYLLYSDLGRSGFLPRIVTALSHLLDRKELELGSRDEPETKETERNRLLSMTELLMQVCLALSGQEETAALLANAGIMDVLCDSSKQFFKTLSLANTEFINVPINSTNDPRAALWNNYNNKDMTSSAYGMNTNNYANDNNFNNNNNNSNNYYNDNFNNNYGGSSFGGKSSFMSQDENSKYNYEHNASYPQQQTIPVRSEISNGYFRVWCLMVSTVTRTILNNNNSQADFMKSAMLFASIHKKRIMFVLTSAVRAPFVVTLAIIQEAYRCCQLLYELAQQNATWKLHDINTVVELEKSALTFLSQCSFLLGRPETLAQYCRPGKSIDGPLVTDDEDSERFRLRQSRNAVRKNVRSSLAHSMIAPPLRGTEQDGVDPTTGISFMERMQCEIFDAMRTCLAFCRRNSPKLWQASMNSMSSMDNTPMRLIPLFHHNIVRPVSMNEMPSLGTLDLSLAVLTHQLSDYLDKAITRLNLKEVDVMSISRIESSVVLSSLDEEEETESRAESKKNKKAMVFLRACNVILNSIEECLYLLICHCHFFLAKDNVDRKHSPPPAPTSNISNMSMSNMPSITSFHQSDYGSRPEVRMNSSISSKLSDELASSILRQIIKLTKLLDNRIETAPPKEKLFLEEKRSFINFANDYFQKILKERI